MTDYQGKLATALRGADPDDRLDAIIAVANRIAEVNAEVVQPDLGNWLAAAVAGAAAQFVQPAAFRILDACGIRDQTARDREVATVVLKALEDAILSAASSVRP
jgi:hypothetical protein